MAKTIRIPSADTARKEGRSASRLGIGRGLDPAATIRADIPNVTASKPSVRYGSTTATTAAPVTNPRIWLAWKLMLPTAEPSTNMSLGSASGSSAARADENGAPASGR